MKHAQEIVKALVLGEGSVALSLAVIVLALWFFPVLLVVYLSYLLLLAYVQDQARRWLKGFLTTWLRLVVCAAFSLGCIGGSWQITPLNLDLFTAELHPYTFSFYTTILVGIWLFWLCVDAAKELWRRRIE